MFVSVYDLVQYLMMQGYICVRHSASLWGHSFAWLTRGTRDGTQCFLERGADEGDLDREAKARVNVAEYQED